jgi:hypothetical protein
LVDDVLVAGDRKEFGEPGQDEVDPKDNANGNRGRRVAVVIHINLIEKGNLQGPAI